MPSRDIVRVCVFVFGHISTFATSPRHPPPPLRPRSLKVSIAPGGIQWPNSISFANSFRSNILRTDMLSGSRVHQNRISLSKLATSVLYALADSTAFSTLYFPPKINPTYQSIMNNLFPGFPNTLARVLLVLIITVRTELTWRLNQTFMPLGSCDLRSDVPSLTSSQPR